MRTVFSGIFILLFAALVIGSAQGYLFLTNRPSDTPDEVIFEVTPGQSVKAVAKGLFEQNLVTDADKFYWFARFHNAAAHIRVGEYAIARNLLPREVLDILVGGHSVEHSVTLQEGLNIYEIAELLQHQGFANKDEFLRLVRDRAFIKDLLQEDLPSLEGYLFPETYHVTKYTGTKGLIRMMVQRFTDVYGQVPDHALSRHQLVTLASIIEKETGAPEERPMISSVFHNRLVKKMRLQTDPTVIYGLFVRSGNWNKNISRKDLSADNPYNTYTRDGLPPGPISNPGRESLLAAAQPANTPYLFFVSKNDGTHAFTATYEDHTHAVSRFQLDKKAREGKSWRDLKKKRAQH